MAARVSNNQIHSAETRDVDGVAGPRILPRSHPHTDPPSGRAGSFLIGGAGDLSRSTLPVQKKKAELSTGRGCILGQVFFFKKENKTSGPMKCNVSLNLNSMTVFYLVQYIEVLFYFCFFFPLSYKLQQPKVRRN